MLIKIISGGQTGVDQAALDAALHNNLDIGGWCPPGRKCQAGLIPALYALQETPRDRSDFATDLPRSLRTEWNVKDSDASLILMPEKYSVDKGTSFTIQCCKIYGKPLLVLDPYNANVVKLISNWIKNSHLTILNIAGPDENSVTGIHKATYKTLDRVLKEIIKY